MPAACAYVYLIYAVVEAILALVQCPGRTLSTMSFTIIIMNIPEFPNQIYAAKNIDLFWNKYTYIDNALYVLETFSLKRLIGNTQCHAVQHSSILSE